MPFLRLLLMMFLSPLIVSDFAWGNSPKIQVLVGKSLHKIQIRGKDLIKTYKHRPFSKKYDGSQTLVLDCQKRIHASSWKNGPLLASISTEQGGILEWKKNRYQGEFTVVRSENKNGCDLVHEVDIDHYISTLVAKEMHKDWPLEALKAQAVAARTYALYKQQTRQKDDSGQYFDLENSEKDQVSGSMDDVNANTYRAAYLTQGEVLLSNKKEISPAFYHSKCGGKTHLPEQVWGNPVAGYQPVECPFCKNKGQPTWKTQLSFSKVASTLVKIALGSKTARNQTATFRNFFILPHKQDDQEIYFKFNDQIFKARKAQIRIFLGREKIPSHNFTLELGSSLAVFRGEGLGHGVGLCQIGALELAKRGYNYRQILSFYYPDFQLKNYY